MNALAPWQIEAQDIGGEVDARPNWTAEGVPMCSWKACPRMAHDGCDALCTQSNVCVPVVAQMARALRAAP